VSTLWPLKVDGPDKFSENSGPSLKGRSWLSLRWLSNSISLSTIRQITWLAVLYRVINYSALAKQNQFHQFEWPQSQGNYSPFCLGNLSSVRVNWQRDRARQAHHAKSHALPINQCVGQSITRGGSEGAGRDSWQTQVNHEKQWQSWLESNLG